MDTVEVKILNYTFRFRRLYWRDEFAIKFPKNKDPYRVMMAHALVDVSGIPVNTIEEANKVLDSLPYAIMERVYRVWRGSFPAARRFVTANLYKAPDPILHEQRVRQEEAETGEIDPQAKEVEAKFGTQQLQEARELQRQILKASQLRGATKATEDNG